MGMVGEDCLPSNAYYPRTPDYTLYSGVHVCWSEHSDSSFVYGFMSLDYGLGTMTATTPRRPLSIQSATSRDSACVWYSEYPYTVSYLPYAWKYSEPSLQRQHVFPKILPLKWICCCKESLMDRMICKKRPCFILISSQHIWFGYLLESPQWSNSNKYAKPMLLEVLMQYSCISFH